MTIQGLARRVRQRVLYVGVGGAALAVLAAMALPGGAGAATAAPAAAGAAVTLSTSPLGIDVAPWDPVSSDPATFSTVQPLLKAAGINQLHYGGGVTADMYDWQTDTDIADCPTTALAEYNAGCATNDALDFAKYSADTRAMGAQSFVTVNYGTGTSAMAAAWVKQAAATPSEAVADWEIGNESYGCWEDDNWLAAAPANYAGYVPNVSSTCPQTADGEEAGMEIMANSYAANAGQYMTAMKKADPNAKIGVPWAFDWTVGGASVGYNNTWNDTVLGDDGKNISFVDAHWYPFSFGGITGANGNPTDQQVIQSVLAIPSEYAKIQTELNAYDPTAKVIVGETGVSYLATNVPCTPAGALFAAGDVLSWLAAGAQSVDWWPLDTNANLTSACASPDEAMLTNTGAPNSPYTGYVLASALAQPNARLSTLSTSDSADVLAFQSVLPNGRVAVALVNTNTSAAKKVTFGSSLSGYLSTQTYSAANQNATNSKTVAGTSTSSAIANGVTLPAESIMILKGSLPSAMTLTSSGTSVQAGTRLTFKGKLTLNGAAAPAGVPVRVSRVAAGQTQATQTVRTVAGGSFTATDLPPAYGSYTYSASYLSNTYVPAAASAAVKVAALKPTLKLAVSAKSVKPGRKVTVTATLSASHTDRTLVVYAQPKGGVKKVIKRAVSNTKGQVGVAFPVTANTTFSVVFGGDTWYSAGSATVVVAA